MRETKRKKKQNRATEINGKINKIVTSENSIEYIERVREYDLLIHKSNTSNNFRIFEYFGSLSWRFVMKLVSAYCVYWYETNVRGGQK